MGKVNVYLPDDLEREARQAGISISAVCQAAMRDVLDTVAAVSATSFRGQARGRLTSRLADILADLEARAEENGRPVTPHDLLGAILLHGENLGAHALRNLGVDLPPPAPRSPRRRKRDDAMFADETRQVLTAAVGVAIEMRHNYVGAEHVVIALSEASSPVHELFAALGVDARSLRAEVERLLVNPWRAPRPQATAAPVLPADLVARFESELQRLSDELGDLKQRLSPERGRDRDR